MAVKSVVAVINGQSVTLTYNSSTGNYEATVTAPSSSSYPLSGHYYPVSVTATDDAGNQTTVDDSDATLGANLRLQVKEHVAPVITITAPTSGSYIISNQPTIQWTVTDDDSGVDESSISITLDGTEYTSGITKTAITGGFSCEFTPATALSDGSHTASFAADDNDGNAATAKTTTFTVDTVPPTLSVTAPEDNSITNVAAVTVTGITNDVTSSPVTLTVQLNSGTPEVVTVGQDGSFSKNLTLALGSNTITVVATDSAGKSSTVTRTVTLDQSAPVISAVTITPNPVDAGQTYIISVTVSD